MSMLRESLAYPEGVIDVGIIVVKLDISANLAISGPKITYRVLLKEIQFTKFF